MKLKKQTLATILGLIFGFNKLLILTPVTLTTAVIFFKDIYKLGVLNKHIFIYCSLFIMAFIPVFTIGISRFPLENGVPVLINFVVFLIFLIVFLSFNKTNKERIVTAAIIMMGIEALIMTYYSIYTDPLLYGYGRILDPFTGNVINTPSISNVLSLFSILLLINISYQKGMALSSISLILLLFSILAAIFLSQRSYFIILFIGSIYVLFRGNLLKALMIFSLLFFVMLFIYMSFDEVTAFADRLELFINRFRDISDSQRIRLILDFLSYIISHPLGGFRIDFTEHYTYWAHNLFIDSARLGGWISALLLIINFTYPLFYYIFLKSESARKEDRMNIFFFLITLLLVSQDVIIDGNILMLYLGIMLGIIILEDDWEHSY